MGEELRLTLFGGLGATLGGTSLDLPYRKALALLAYLATTRRPHPRETLSTLLWGESSDTRARSSLRTALRHLRGAADPFLIVERDFVAFNGRAPHWVDAVQFVAQVSRVRRRTEQEGAIVRFPVLAERHADMLRQTVELYHGEFLEDFAVRRAPLFDEWVLRRQEQARDLAMWALHQLVHFHAARVEYQTGLEAVERLLAIAPWREEAHRDRMMLLALSGRRHGALAQYETCRNVLAEAFGMEPTLRTELLYQTIKRGRPLPDWGTRAHSRRLHLAPWHDKLVSQEDDLLGRSAESRRLAGLLTTSSGRLVSLVGPEGVGKSRLALAIADAVANRYAQGAWFISVEPREDEPEPRQGGEADHDSEEDSELKLVSAIGQALGLTFSTDSPLSTQMRDYLRHRQLLLVLDEIDPSPAETEFLLSILRRTPGISMLLVGTEALGVEEEAILELEGLDVPESPAECSEILERLAARDGVQLFVRRAMRASPAFELSPDTARHVAHLCLLTAGLPLAIELAASWVGELPLSEMAADVENRLLKLREERSMSSASAPVEAVFSHVWDRLSADERRDLAQLASFRGAFSDDAALGVFRVSRRRLTSLCERALLIHTAFDRYQLHPLLRRLLVRKLGALGSEGDAVEAAAARGHPKDHLSAHYLGVLESHCEALRTRAARAACSQIRSDWPHIRDAWYRASRQLDRERLTTSLDGLSRFLSLQGWLWEGEKLFDAAAQAMLSAAERSGDNGDTALACRILSEKAGFLNAQLRWDEAARVAQTVIALVNRSRDGHGAAESWPILEARARLAWGRALHTGTDLQAARRQIERALKLVAGPDHARIEAAGLQYLGLINVEREKFEEAWVDLEEALHLYDDINDLLGKSQVLGVLGLVALARRAYAEGEAHVTEALTIAELLGDRDGISLAHTYMGRIALARGDAAAAAIHCRDGLRRARQVGCPLRESQALTESAWVSIGEGALERAWNRGLLAVELARLVGHAAAEGRARLAAGRAMAELQMTSQARWAYGEALQLQRQLEQFDAATESLAGLASLSLAEGDPDRAKELVEEILGRLAVSELSGARHPVSVCLACYRALSVFEDERADDLLRMASQMHKQRTWSE